MMWTPDPAMDEARKLPDWARFHRECGKLGLSFDIPHRPSNRGPFTVVAFTPRKNDHGGYTTYELSRATGSRLLQTIKRAHDDSGRGTATTSELLDRLINPVAAAPDPLEGMFG